VTAEQIIWLSKSYIHGMMIYDLLY